MSKYNLTCDNGQVMPMELVEQPGVTIDGEIAKLEELFAQLASDKALTGQQPAGWPDPLPTKVVSYAQI